MVWGETKNRLFDKSKSGAKLLISKEI